MHRFAAASTALAVAVLSAGAASAQSRIAYGDLNLGSAAGAAQFDRRVDRAARAVCGGRSSLSEATCTRQFRAEATRRLPQSDRTDYARARTEATAF